MKFLKKFNQREIPQERKAMKKSKPNPERDEGLFENLPQEITIHILSYLPIGAIITCRRVCKTWHELIGSPEFATSHLAKSSAATCVAVVQNVKDSILQRLCVFAEEHDAARDDSTLVSQFGYYNLHEQASSPKGLLLFKTFPMLDENFLFLTIHGSANGFLFWNTATSKGYSLFVCNPITREYIGLNFRRRPQGVMVYNSVLGFGVSRRSGHYKIVRLFRELSRFSGLSKSVCKGEVYTLGTGLWRSVVEVEMPYQYCYRGNEPSDPGAFVNGNLHWLIFDRNNNARVCCFDLETELFASFSPPRGLPPRIYGQGYWLCVLDGRLCLSNNAGSDVDIWLMKEYGDESSWERELSIKKPVGGIDGFLHPLKVFKNGDSLFVVTHNPAQLYWYSSKTKAIKKYGDVEKPYFIWDRRAAAYTPSFVSLKTLATKNNVDRVRSW